MGVAPDRVVGDRGRRIVYIDATLAVARDRVAVDFDRGRRIGHINPGETVIADDAECLKARLVSL